jgi:pyrroline-5-carboxylate reductase
MGRIFVLGAGAMAESFIKGLLGPQGSTEDDVVVMNRSRPDRLTELANLYGITPAESIADASECDVVVVAVKPYDVGDALQALKPHLRGQLLISFAAGIPISFMERQTDGRAQVIRTMPNVPVAVLEGATAMTASEGVRPEAAEEAKRLLSKIGIVVELPEELMDAATAFSGSGPGFVSYFLEAMEDAAVQLGFDAKTARSLLIQTVVGTAKVLEEWGLSPAELRTRVTSPNGTTHAGLKVLGDSGMPEAISKALMQAARRSQEMGLEYTRDEE